MNEKQIAAWVGGGANKALNGAMPNFGSLGATKLAQIAQVIASLKAGKVVPLQQ